MGSASTRQRTDGDNLRPQLIPNDAGGCRLATSAPIMERLGFTLHGYARSIAEQTR